MRQGILILNLLMVVGTAVLADRLISGWEAFEETNSLERLVSQVEPGQEAPANVGVALEEGARPFPEFLIIAEKNLFTPQRGPEAEEEAEPEEVKPPVLPMKPALTGVSMMRGERLAYLTVYEGKKSSGKSRAVAVGDEVQGYKVSEITDTTVLLTWRDQEVIIDIFDTKGAPQQAAAAHKGTAVTVITVGAAPAAVETTTASASKEKEGRGLEVGRAGSAGGQAGAGGRAASARQGGMGQGGRGQAGRGRGGLGRGGLGRGGGGRGGLGGGRGQSGYGGQGRGLPGNLGLSGGRGQGRRY